MDAGSAPRLRSYAAFLWAAGCAVLFVHAGLLWRFAVDWPLHDDFTQILAVPGYLAQMHAQQKLAFLVSLTPEHRIATLRLAGWMSASLPGGMDFRLLIAVGNAMALAGGAIAVRQFPRRLRPPAFLLAVLLLTSVTHYGAQYWATGALQHFGVSFYALAAIFIASRSRQSLLAAPIAVAAALTSANGLMVFPAIALAVALEHRRREAFAWMLGGGVLFALYFVGYVAPSGQPSFVTVFREPLHLAWFGLATLGGIGGTLAVSVSIGALVVAIWIFAIKTGAWRRVPPIVASGALFFILSCAMIALGRAILGAEAVTLSRYRVYSAFAVLLSIAALAYVVNIRSFRWILGTTVAGASALYAFAWIAIMPFVLELSVTQTALRNHFAAEGRGVYEGYTQEFGDFTLRRALELRAYLGSEDATPPVAAVAADRPSETSDALHAKVHVGSRVVSIAGWIAHRRQDVDLWIANDRQSFRARLATVRYPPGAGPRTAVHGTVALADIPPGSYRLGLGGTEVTWMADPLVIR